MDTINESTVIKSQEEILGIMTDIISEIIGEEFMDDIEVQETSSFTGDLEMDSIEIVSFSDEIKKHFGKEIDFTGWLTNMDLDQIINLKIKDVIDYIQKCQS